jgi:mono/diheme cytochrome c family protein
LAFGVTLSQTACRAPASKASIATTRAIASLEGHALFTAHCAPCHGATGGGRGPAAIALGVAPRDFRHERFRYVSTLNGVPTDEDLTDSIRYGRRYGEMPASPQLTDAEVRTLAKYIREIQRFGWRDDLREEFADDDDTSPEEIEEISYRRVKPRDPIHVGRPEPGFRRDLDKGRELYAANCASCHGLTGRGDGMDKPLDEQGKPLSVRDLTSGGFRGGTKVEEVFKRIRCGVPGTPMSAAVALSDEEVWQLVYYVRYLAGRR